MTQKVADQRAYGARHDAHRDHRHRDGGQDHEAEVLPVPGPAARSRTDRGQPAELHREHDHQHHTKPIVRHRDAGDRDRGHQLVDPTVAEISGQKAEHDAEHEADQRREHRQHHGVADRADDFLGDRAPGRDRGAEIAVHGLPGPETELNRQRPVEAIGLAHLVSQRLACIRRQHRDERVAGRDMDEQETYQRHREHHGNDEDQALGDVDEHSDPVLMVRSVA